jgi:hypothetical protein
LRQDSRGIDWPEKDWFPSVGSCELLINNVKQSEIFGDFCNTLRKFFGESSTRKFYLIQEEVAGDETPEDLEFSITNLSEIPQSRLFGSSYNSLLCDEDFTFALKLHHERFGFLSGPDKLCEILRQGAAIRPALEEVQWKE